MKTMCATYRGVYWVLDFAPPYCCNVLCTYVSHYVSRVVSSVAASVRWLMRPTDAWSIKSFRCCRSFASSAKEQPTPKPVNPPDADSARIVRRHSVFC